VFPLTVTESTLELKGEMLMLNVLRLQDIDIDRIEAVLQQKRDEAPLFFVQSPVVVDCSELSDEQGKELDLNALRRILIKMDFVPVGLRGISNSMLAASMSAGWNLLRSSAKKIPQSKTIVETDTDVDIEITSEISSTDNNPLIQANREEPTEHAVTIENALMVKQPIRSGQQVYAKNRDLVILSQTSAGSEVMSDGSIHVYGPLRGRVLAGVKGNKTARIFCRSLEAELIVIAGCYQLLDESDTDLKGKPAMIRLDNDKLIIESID
jgi:septum site-determining protein MinC